MPRVTVLIAARNAAATLVETLDSLQEQTFRDFDVLMVNDASTDNTEAIARAYSATFPIGVITLEQNAGVAGALNFGLANNVSPYIARIDADDIALPTRLEKQVALLDSRPDIDVCSTWMEMFYEEPGRPSQILAKPTDDATIKTALVQYSSMSHGSSMFRKSFFDDIGVFDIRLDFAEDYDLWCRGALLGKHYTNLPEPLTRYRQHGAQVGKEKRQLQYERDLIIKRKYMSALLGGGSPGNLAEFFSLLTVFVSKDVALSVIEQSMPLIFKLGSKISDEKYYCELVGGSIRRHLS